MVQQQIAETMREVLGRKSKLRLEEQNYKMCEILRKPILEDEGSPSMKKAWLQLVESNKMGETFSSQIHRVSLKDRT